MIKQRTAKTILLCVLSVTLLSIAFPAVSGYVKGELESGNLVFRGYNFAEVSKYGWMAVSLLLAAITLLLVNLSFSVQCISTSLLGIFGCGCYLGGFFSAKQFLYDAGVSFVKIRYGFYVALIFWLITIILPIIFARTIQCEPGSSSNDFPE